MLSVWTNVMLFIKRWSESQEENKKIETYALELQGPRMQK
jgi:hypothetical protein